MTLQLAIIADDLTGALDCAAPFAARGLRTAAALLPEELAISRDRDLEVIAVDTATRHLPAPVAAGIAAAAARTSKARGVRLTFKKIDSRLRGAVAAESEAMAAALGAGRLLVSPAVPAQGRFVRAGKVVGRGLPEPGLDIRTALGALALELEVPDVASDHDLDRLAAVLLADGRGTLAVGAHGLASAIARQLRPQAPPPSPWRPCLPCLVIAGSQDPATAVQLMELAGGRSDVAVVDAPDGRLPATPAAPPAPVTVLRSLAGDGSADLAGERFAAGAAGWLAQLRPAMAMLTGGETARAVLLGLGRRRLEVGGEALPGMAWSLAADGPTLVTKSGGFGMPDALLRLLAGARGAV